MAVDKLVDSAQLDADLTSVANAIRFKADISGELLFPSGFVNAIGNISSGVNVEPLTVTEDGTYTAPEGTAYSPVTVNVSGGGDDEPVAIEPIATDYMGGYISSDGSKFVYEDSANNRIDVYQVSAGASYRLSLEDVVGTRFRAVIISQNPVGSTSDIAGTSVVAIANPDPNASVTFRSTTNGYLTVQKDNTGQSGIVTHLLQIFGKVCVGNFIGTTDGEMKITIPYTGDGYPIAFSIFPSDAKFYSLVNTLSFASYNAVKQEIYTIPNYIKGSGTENQAYISVLYKYSASTKYTAGYGTATSYYIQLNPGSSLSAARVYSNNELLVNIKSPSDSSSYGFANGIRYTYVVTYME